MGIVASAEGKSTERFFENPLNLENLKSEVRLPSSKETLQLRRYRDVPDYYYKYKATHAPDSKAIMRWVKSTCWEEDLPETY